MYEERIQQAVALFKRGYNCSQAVVAAFADLYDFTPEQALRMAASFGGGIGRMRQTCGAACGMFLLAGLDSGSIEAEDREGKSRNYAIVQQLAARFKEENGALECATLLGLKPAEPVSATAAERTATYYAKRPCAMMVESAARIFAEYLSHHEDTATR
jgi:C_GCAxxG_C_C family probable redox protein